MTSPSIDSSWPRDAAARNLRAIAWLVGLGTAVGIAFQLATEIRFAQLPSGGGFEVAYDLAVVATFRSAIDLAIWIGLAAALEAGRRGPQRAWFQAGALLAALAVALDLASGACAAVRPDGLAIEVERALDLAIGGARVACVAAAMLGLVRLARAVDRPLDPALPVVIVGTMLLELAAFSLAGGLAVDRFLFASTAIVLDVIGAVALVVVLWRTAVALGPSDDGEVAAWRRAARGLRTAGNGIGLRLVAALVGALVLVGASEPGGDLFAFGLNANLFLAGACLGMVIVGLGHARALPSPKIRATLAVAIAGFAVAVLADVHSVAGVLALNRTPEGLLDEAPRVAALVESDAIGRIGLAVGLVALIAAVRGVCRTLDDRVLAARAYGLYALVALIVGFSLVVSWARAAAPGAIGLVGGLSVFLVVPLVALVLRLRGFALDAAALIHHRVETSSLPPIVASLRRG